jgi:putative Mg2+ transporter-C (MgtC) family protein
MINPTIISWSVTARLVLSILLGSVIGFEREYRSKAAGFRTITLITLGSATFTILSAALGQTEHDRLAANIITGIGFIGAGVIFKNGLTVSGLTTSAAIWVSAAVGMAVGAGEYFLAFGSCVGSIVVLAGFEKLQDMIEKGHQVRTYRVVFHGERYNAAKVSVEELAKESGAVMKTRKYYRAPEGPVMQFSLGGSQTQLDSFSELLLGADVLSFDEG